MGENIWYYTCGSQGLSEHLMPIEKETDKTYVVNCDNAGTYARQLKKASEMFAEQDSTFVGQFNCFTSDPSQRIEAARLASKAAIEYANEQADRHQRHAALCTVTLRQFIDAQA